MSKILDNLYLGSDGDAKNLFLLKKLKITHIVTVAVELKPLFPSSFLYLHILAHDREDFKLIKYFNQIAEFIYNAIYKDKGTVFVHCMWGISRSASSVIAYLIKYDNMSYIRARRHVKLKRAIINPNNGFIKQLQSWETICKNLKSSEDNNIKNTTGSDMIKSSNIQEPIQAPRNSLENTKLENRLIIKSYPKKVFVSTSPSHNKIEEEKNDSIDDSYYRCKSCKTMIFSQKNVFSHKNTKTSPYNQCTLIFVDFINWMKGFKNPMSRIFCPNIKCDEIVGFPNNYKGNCSCGYCVKGAYQIFSVRVEKVTTIQPKHLEK